MDRIINKKFIGGARVQLMMVRAKSMLPSVFSNTIIIPALIVN